MPFNGAALTVGTSAIIGAAAYAQAHSGNPGGSGTANAIAGVDRKLIDWGTPVDGDVDLNSPIAFTGMNPGQDVKWISVWSADNGGTWYGNFQLTGDTVANALGEFNVTSLAQDASAS